MIQKSEQAEADLEALRGRTKLTYLQQHFSDGIGGFPGPLSIVVIAFIVWVLTHQIASVLIFTVLALAGLVLIKRPSQPSIILAYSAAFNAQYWLVFAAVVVGAYLFAAQNRVWLDAFAIKAPPLIYKMAEAPVRSKAYLWSVLDILIPLAFGLWYCGLREWPFRPHKEFYPLTVDGKIPLKPANMTSSRKLSFFERDLANEKRKVMRFETRHFLIIWIVLFVFIADIFDPAGMVRIMRGAASLYSFWGYVFFVFKISIFALMQGLCMLLVVGSIFFPHDRYAHLARANNFEPSKD